MTTYTKRDLTRLLVDLINHHCPIKDLQVVIKAGADPNQSHRKGLKPLHYAAYEDSVDVVRYLADEVRADINVEDDLGYTPLHIACKHGCYESASTLLRRGAVVNFVGERAAGSATSRVMASLIVNPLSLALENGNHDCVAALLRYGADANQKYFLGHEMNLVPMENHRSLELLLEYSADPDVFSRGGLSPLMKACKDKHLESVRVLLTHGATVNLLCPPKFDQKSALHFAATSGIADIVQCLLEHGARTQRPLEFDHSPLEFAIVADKHEAVETLLKYGADPNEVNEERCSPLQFAVSTMGLKHRKQIIEHLLHYGGNPNHHSQYFSYMGPSLSPLLEYFGYMEEYDINLVKLMLSYGANINMTRPTRLLKIRDACGVLGQLRKMRPYEDIFELLLDSAGKFDIESILKESSLSNGQKESLLEIGAVPRDLRHLTRLSIRESLSFPIAPKIGELPLPNFLINYLLFNANM